MLAERVTRRFSAPHPNSPSRPFSLSHRLGALSICPAPPPLGRFTGSQAQPSLSVRQNSGRGAKPTSSVSSSSSARRRRSQRHAPPHLMPDRGSWTPPRCNALDRTMQPQHSSSAAAAAVVPGHTSLRSVLQPAYTHVLYSVRPSGRGGRTARKSPRGPSVSALQLARLTCSMTWGRQQAPSNAQ